LEEVIGHFHELEADASLPARLDVLLDLTPMDSLPESYQLKSVAAEMDRMQSKVTWGRFAVVADRDALYGMIRMFQVFTENVFVSSRVFRSLEEAGVWLGSPRPAGAALHD
jgi:hypothetical protein